MITVICEEPKKKASKNKLIKIFSNLKKEFPYLEANLRIVTSVDTQMRACVPRDNECFIVFGSKLYNPYLLKDVNEFDQLIGNTVKRDVHKFSYFIRKKNICYFLAFMPPVDFTMSKDETFIALESCLFSLSAATEKFKLTIREVFLQRGKESRKDWPIEIIENGFSPKVYLHYKFEDSKNYLLSLFKLPDWHDVAVDIETSGLKLWDIPNFVVYIASFSTEDNIGHAINLGLPGLIGALSEEQKKELLELLKKYIFEKPKTFIAWNAGFDVFGLCNFFGKTLNEFTENNHILDAMQLLHVFSENRKIEGYNAKVASRDLLNYAQYSYLEQYLEYIANWKTYTVEQILEAVNKSLQYAAEDAAGEKALASLLIKELDMDDICINFKNSMAQKIFLVKLNTEWNGLRVDLDNMVKNSISFGGWEVEQIVKPTIMKCQESTDGKSHAEMFVFSTVLGRMLYKKPVMHQMKINTNLAQYFLADEDCSLVHVDLSSADLRSVAFTVQDKTLIEDLNSDEDIYENFAKQIFKRELEEGDRDKAKTFILSMLNLAGANTIAKEAKISVQDVEEYKNVFYSRYPNMLVYQNKLKEYLKENGFVFSPSFRKRRFSDDDLSKEKFWSTFLSAHNFPYASLTADFMMLNCYNFLTATKRLNVKQCLLNADAATFNIPNEHLEEAREKLEIFASIPSIFWEGATKFQEEIMKTPPQNGFKIRMPVYKFKASIGKDLKNMENFKEVILRDRF